MNISKITMAAAVMILAAACVKVEETASGGGVVEGERVEMTFRLTTSDMSSPTVSIPLEPAGEDVAGEATASAGVAGVNGVHGTDGVMTVTMDDPATRAEAGDTEQVGTDDENKITGLWVLQFESTAPEAKLVSRDYYPSESIVDSELAVSFIEAEGNIRAYFVANVGADYFKTLPVGSETTLSSFEDKVCNFNPTATVPDNGLPMVGVYNGIPSSMGGSAITLTRMVAKINFTCNVALASAAETFVVKEVQLVSAAAFSAFIAPSVPTGEDNLYPDSSQPGNFVDATLEEESQSSFSRTWYVAENLRGVKSGLSEPNRGKKYAPAGSTYIEITGDYTKSGEMYEVAYRIYVGRNKTDNFNIERNYIYTIASNIKGMDENDLRVEVKRGEDLSINGTANCYMVHKADETYKFNATVMGNNKESASFAMHNAFAPTIKPEVLKPASAKVIWETGEKGSVIAEGSVVLKDDEIFFTTAASEGENIAEGNAVIGALDEGGNIIWSWHIWATKYDPETDVDILVNHDNKTYYTMKYNLGADATSEIGTLGRYGLYYQWGRKDPFIGGSLINGGPEAKTSYEAQYKWEWEVTLNQTPSYHIAYAIQNPTHFIISSTAISDWVTSSRENQRDNLWGNPKSGSLVTEPNTDVGSKSIYDPCPPGWRVPPQDTWTGFTKTGQNTSNSADMNIAKFNNGFEIYTNGSNSSTTFYPAAGYRGYYDGTTIVAASTNGYCWSSSTVGSNGFDSSYLDFSGGSLSPMSYNGHRAFGFNVRCVKEDIQVQPDETIDLSIDATANSYIVGTPATSYKFNATVMGNGKSTAAFEPTENGVRADAIEPIELKPAWAKVLWETDTKGSVIVDGSVRLKGNEVYFTTAATEDGTINEGNALIGVFDSSNKLIWSWHIWSTKYDPKTSFDILVNHGDYEPKTYYSMKFNLGANATSATAVPGSYGLYYQWGRKDPFIGTPQGTANDSGYVWNWNVAASSSEVTADPIEYAIQHPTHFIINGSVPNDWVTTDANYRRDNLWGNPNDTEGTNPEVGSKSIYDPCPPGWCVPPQDTWTGFTTTGANSTTSSEWSVDIGVGFKNGWTFYTGGSTSGVTTFMPAAGYRSSSNGAVTTWGSSGCYWSSSPFSNSQHEAGAINFDSSAVNVLTYNGRADGFSIRCVREQ